MQQPQLPIGYELKTITYKTVDSLTLKLDVIFPQEKRSEPIPVVIHYHGGFLITGDRQTFLPYWLLNACATRKWIFVSPDYRLLPEVTAHEAVADALDAFNWVKDSLQDILGASIGSIISAGSSAGAYLAVTSATSASVKPDALLLIYGMLHPTSEWYTKKGTTIFGMPPIDGQSILDQFASLKEQGQAEVLSGYPMPSDPTTDSRMGLISAAHCEAVFPDLITGVPGLSREISCHGTVAIPQDARKLFVIASGGGAKLPRTAIFHGKNDNAVPFASSAVAAETLTKLGVKIYTEFPDDAAHGFDTMAGNVDLDQSDIKTPAWDSLRGIIKFLDTVAER